MKMAIVPARLKYKTALPPANSKTTNYTYDDLDRMESYTITDHDTGNTSETVYTFYASYDRETEVVTDTVSGVPTVSTNERYAYDETPAG